MLTTSTLEADLARPSLGDTVVRPFAAVRVATPEDEGELVAMLHLMHKEAGLCDSQGQPFPIAEDKMRSVVQRAIIPNRNDPNAGKSVCGIIGAPGALEASICLGIATTWYSDMPFLGDFWCYVKPDFRRGTLHAKTLIAFAKTLADTCNMELQLGIVGTERTNAKDRFLERQLGAKPFGRYFVYHPRSGAKSTSEHIAGVV